MPGNMFDYISNIRPISGGNGAVGHYEVEVGRFSCPEPVSVPVVPLAAAQPVYVPMPVATAAVMGGGGYFCFAADSKACLAFLRHEEGYFRSRQRKE